MLQYQYHKELFIFKNLTKSFTYFVVEWTIAQITKGPCQNDMVGPISRNLSTLPIYITIFSGEHVDIKNHQPITLCVKPNKGNYLTLF